jgi:hypothetical protein
MDLFHFFAEYRDRGHSVIPVIGKVPAIPTWNEFRKRLATWDEIRYWSSRADFGIAIVTGKLSGLVVIDCDSKADAEWALARFPKSPLMVHTGGGRGGLHIYFRQPDTVIGNRAKIHSRAIDVRGEGGYVIAPPSKHPVTGQHYTWASFGDYALEEIPVLDAALLGTTTRSMNNGGGSIRDGAAYIRSIRAISGQGGHNATFRAACRLRDSGMRREEALAILVEWNETNAEPRWTVKELLHKVQSAYEVRSRS